MKILRLFALLLLSALVQPALALNYCKCDPVTAAATGCLDGSDLNDGSDANHARYEYPTDTVINNAAAGTHFSFCRTGLWPSLSTIGLANSNSTAASPIVFDDYIGSWGDGDLPHFTYSGHAAYFFGTFGGPQTAGYTFRNLFIDAVSCTNQADHAFNYNGTGVTDVLWDGIEVAHFGFFLELPVSNSGRTAGRFTLRNSIIRDSYDIGLLGFAEDILIEGNTWLNNGGADNTATGGGICEQGSGFAHHMYLSGETGSRVVIRNNYFANAGNGGTGGTTCTSGGITFHGVWDQVVVERNTIDNSGGEGAGCGGIDINAGYTFYEAFNNFTIKDNTCINCGISLSNSNNAVVENNRIIKLSNYYGCCGIVIPRDDGNGSGPADQVPTGFLRVRNNSVSFPSNATSGICYQFNNASGHGTGAEITNNLCKIESGGTGVKCFGYMTFGNYTIADYNLGYGCSPWATGGGTTYSTMADAQAAGYDTHSVNTDPLWLTTPTSTNTTWGLQVQSGSPAKNAGTNTYCSRLDALGSPRSDGSCDIGAREQGNGL